MPRQILRAMRATMLLCKRKEVPRDLAQVMVSYVCTEGEEWAQLQRKIGGK